MYNIKAHHLEFVKQFEGFSSKCYMCPAGVKTIGFGHVLKAQETYDQINLAQAEELLALDLQYATISILRNIRSRLNDNQFTAILSFTFNLGGAALQRSTLRQKINAKLHNQIPYELNKWVWARGRKLPGLIKRRIIEGLHYNS